MADTGLQIRRRKKQKSQTSQPSRRSPTHTAEKQKWGASTIPHLREALDTLESQMATLMFERKMLERKLERAVRLQSPIQRLPGELLGYIFLVGALQQDSEDTILLSTLMLVCKEWEEVAKNTPALWSRIVIENSTSLAKARFKLDRSKGVPVDITIQFSPHFEHTRTITELVVHAMDILRPAMWRWRTFRIAVPSRAHAHVRTHSMQGAGAASRRAVGANSSLHAGGPLLKASPSPLPGPSAQPSNMLLYIV